jgi:hypothetical protein
MIDFNYDHHLSIPIITVLLHPLPHSQRHLYFRMSHAIILNQGMQSLRSKMGLEDLEGSGYENNRDGIWWEGVEVGLFLLLKTAIIFKKNLKNPHRLLMPFNNLPTQ